ncbi:MAG: efflux RND transporter periplasmic adaptor subunit [Ignavibacteria bacterium CG_4_9_14_3_um_filter_36_18]|nr:MAG: efflux RND transporter periplasmic adaptor subunit [Ignavibacteria bacterium CG_4_9_14_3_um_filter_36_18]
MKIKLIYHLIKENKPMVLKRFFLLPILTALLFLSPGCGGGPEEEAKSIEQIREEEGIPVKLDVVKLQPFEKYYSYFARLSGVKEATKGAAFGGKIEKINLRVGDNVAQNQVVVQMAEDNPGLQYIQAKAALDNAEKTYLRMKKLLEAGETSQANFDGAEVQYLVAKQNVDAQRQLLFVQSPFAGTIVDIMVSEGDNVKSEAHLFTVAQLGRVKAEVWASSGEVREIKRGMKAFVECGGKQHYGRVTKVAMSSDPYKQAFSVEMEFDNSKRELMCGVTNEIKILTYENPKAIVVPRSLVNKDEHGTYVFIEENEKAVKRYVSNGNDSGLNFEIKTGLKPGEKIITQGIALLKDGKKVKVIK